jgi:hypothetical protein
MVMTISAIVAASMESRDHPAESVNERPTMRPKLDVPQLLTIKETMTRLQIGRTTLYSHLVAVSSRILEAKHFIG